MVIYKVAAMGCWVMTQLAMIINSAVIEIDEDKFGISYGFQGCQLLIFIAVALVMP